MPKRFFIFFYCLLVASCAGATTWRVELDGSGDFTSIQAAFDASAAGDTVRIGRGEFTDLIVTPWNVDWVIAVARSASLTVIGSGNTETVLGLAGEIPWVYGLILETEPRSRTRVKNIGFRNCYIGIYGLTAVLADSCRFTNCYYGTRVREHVQSIFTNCVFDECGTPTMWIEDLDAVEIKNCTFLDSGGIDIDGVNPFLVRDCSFTHPEGPGAHGAISVARSRGVIDNCFIEGYDYSSLGVNFGSTVTLTDCWLSGGSFCVWVVRDSWLSGSGNVLGGGTFATISLEEGGSVGLRNCHLLNAGGYTVQTARRNLSYEIITVDLGDNYWGTDSADSVASWILDINDLADHRYEVIYEPFSAEPVSAQQETAGGVRALFR